MLRFLRKISENLRRSPAELRALQDRKAQRLKMVLFSGILAVTCGLLLTWLLIQSWKWSHLKVAVPVSDSMWHVSFQSDDCVEGRLCLASPDSSLWNAPLTRASENYRILLNQQGARAFWVGARIPAQMLQQAKKQGATNLFLGRMYARYSLWMNGERINTPSDINDSLVLPQLRQHEWESSKELYLAIRLENLNRYQFPELTVFELGAIGFIMPKTLLGIQTLISFSDWARPLSFATLNLLIAVVFFLFWCVDPVKQEYIWFAGFALLQGATQVREVPEIAIQIGKFDTSFVFLLESFEMVFPLVLGLVFIRANQKRVNRVATLFGGLIPILFLGFKLSGLLSYSLIANRYIFLAGSASAIVGAGLCLNEAYVGSKRIPTKRMFRLIAFAATLGLIAFLYWYFISPLAASGTIIDIWHRIVHLGAMIILGTIMFSDVREMSDHSRVRPLSRYHKDPRYIGKPVPGTVLIFDLKKSESLMNYPASRLSPRSILSQVMSPLRLAAVQGGGFEFIDNKGDDFNIFYPEETFPPEDVISKILPEIWNTADRITDSLRADGISPPDWVANYRMVLCYGSLVPVFEIIGNDKTAEWHDGELSPLVIGARLEEAEKKELDPTRTERNVLYSDSFVKKLESRRVNVSVLLDHFLLDHLALLEPILIPVKHRMVLSAYRLKSPHVTPKKAA